MGTSSSYYGAKDWTNEIASTNQEVFFEYRGYAGAWRANAIKMEDARFGRQFSNSEMRELLTFRQAPLPISVSTAICDTADALQVSAKPTISVAPIIHPFDDAYSEQSRNVAGTFKHLIQKAWFDSLGGLQYDRAVFDKTTVGHGLLYAIPRMEHGEFTVDIKNISWKYFYPDPASINPLYDDSDNMIYALKITKKSAYKFIQSIEPDITPKQFEENFMQDVQVGSGTFEEDRNYKRPLKDGLFFVQRLSLERDISYLIIPLDENLNTKKGTPFFRTSSGMTDELREMRARGEIRIETIQKIFLTEYTSVGGLGYKIVYPISEYNIKPILQDHRGTPYPYSQMWYLYPLQRALNKFIMSSILNTALINSTKVMAEENSIVNMREWTQSASQPNVVLRYRLNIPGVSIPPQIIKPTPMDNAFLVMPQFLIKMMEYISGIYGTLQGNPDSSPDVFSTVASLQSAGGQKIKRRQAGADASLSALGKVVGEFYKEYAPMNGFSYDYNPQTGDEDIVKYNELQTVTKGDNGKVKVGIQVNPDNDLRRGFKKVRFISSGSMGYESATEAAMLTTLATQLKLPGLVPAILERINIAGLSKFRDEMDQVKALTASNEQMQEVIDELTKKTKLRENQIFQSAVNLTAAKAKGQLDVELEKFKSDPMGYTQAAMTNQGER